MTLGTIVAMVAIAAIVFTVLTWLVCKQQKSLIMSYAQNFCGGFFIFSGMVKAVDPLGLAYKMEQYFEQFEFVFDGTWFSFMSSLFPILTDYASSLSVFIIVFEIVLGIMLIMGHRPKFTSWSFLGLVLFFTVLTGFTFLTGYVPGDGAFFNFSTWGAYDSANMKVTDCGCFGDFLKLEPKVSFQKDLFLLVPALFFIFRSKTMHVIGSSTARTIITVLATIGLTYFCLSNYVWDIPDNDFRPFKKGVDIAGQKKAEEDAAANVQILGVNLTNKASQDIVELDYNTYLSTFKEYPKEQWSVDYVQSPPALESTKISEFDVVDPDGVSLNDEILGSSGPIFLIVAYQLYGDASPSTRIVSDTTYTLDTIYGADQSARVERSILEVNQNTEEYIDYLWKDFYAQRYEEVVTPFISQAREDNIPSYIAVGADATQIADFISDMNLDVKGGESDDILLKTIVRSNPGIVLFDKGVLVDKWHYKKLPNYSVVKSQHLTK